MALVRDRAMRPLNRRFRSLDETTDVLSFPAPAAKGAAGLAPGGEEMARYIGDVVISVDEALRQAGEDGERPEEAIDRLLIHGLLHLKGYDHHAPGEGTRMRRREKTLGRRLAAMRAAGA